MNLFYFALGAVVYMNTTSNLPTSYKVATYAITFVLFLCHLEYNRLGVLKTKYEEELLQYVRDKKEEERKELREWKEQRELSDLKKLRDRRYHDL